jgi:hypothetical protein
MQYFVKRNEKVNGPFTDAQVKSGVSSGKLNDTDMISNSKEGPWMTWGMLSNYASRQQQGGGSVESGESESAAEIVVELYKDLFEGTAAPFRKSTQDGIEQHEQPTGDPAFDTDQAVSGEESRAPDVISETDATSTGNSRTNNCSDCGGLVSVQVSTCPHCGAPASSDEPQLLWPAQQDVEMGNSTEQSTPSIGPAEEFQQRVAQLGYGMSRITVISILGQPKIDQQFGHPYENKFHMQYIGDRNTYHFSFNFEQDQLTEISDLHKNPPIPILGDFIKAMDATIDLGVQRVNYLEQRLEKGDLIKCYICDGVISYTANSCVHCGAVPPSSPSGQLPESPS